MSRQLLEDRLAKKLDINAKASTRFTNAFVESIRELYAESEDFDLEDILDPTQGDGSGTGESDGASEAKGENKE